MILKSKTFFASLNFFIYYLFLALNAKEVSFTNDPLITHSITISLITTFILFFYGSQFMMILDLNYKSNLFFIALIFLTGWQQALIFLCTNRVLLMLSFFIEGILLIFFFLFFAFFSRTHSIKAFRYLLFLLLFVTSLSLFSNFPIYVAYVLMFASCFYLALKYRLYQRLSQIRVQRFILIGSLISFLPTQLLPMFSSNLILYNLTCLAYIILPLMIGHSLLLRKNTSLYKYLPAWLRQGVYATIITFFNTFFLKLDFVQGLSVICISFLLYYQYSNSSSYRTPPTKKIYSATDEHLELARAEMYKALEYSEYLQKYGSNLLILVDTFLDSKGSALFWNKDNEFTVLAQNGSLSKLQVHKSLRLQKELVEITITTISDYTVVVVPIIAGKTVVAYLLIDPYSLNTDFKLEQRLQSVLGPLILAVDTLQRKATVSSWNAASSPSVIAALRNLRQTEELRKKVADYLHDDILQNILAIKKMAEFAASDATENETMNFIISQLATLNVEIRENMFEFYPSTLSDLPFEESLKILINRIKQLNPKSQISNVQININTVAIPEEISFTIYRMIRELVQNTFKYSIATHLSIHISSTENQLKVRVVDNGIGFNKEKLTEPDFIAQHSGLLSISNDLHGLNGYLDIQSNDKGTDISFYIPNIEE